MEQAITVTWFDHQREPQCEPNPAHPNGIDVDLRAKESARGCMSRTRRALNNTRNGRLTLPFAALEFLFYCRPHEV